MYLADRAHRVVRSTSLGDCEPPCSAALGPGGLRDLNAEQGVATTETMPETTVVKHADGTTIAVTTTAAAEPATTFLKLRPDQLLSPVPSDIECSQSVKAHHISDVRTRRSFLVTCTYRRR